jgi:hypothetical protein
MYVSGLKPLTTLSLKVIKPKKERKNSKIVEQQLLQYFKNAEPEAVSTSINNILGSRGSKRTGKDGEASLDEIKTSLGQDFSYTQTPWGMTPNLKETIQKLRQDGFTLPQNESSPSVKQEVIDVLELKAVERGLRRAVTNTEIGKEDDYSDDLSFKSADKDKNGFLSGTELLNWAKEDKNKATTIDFVQAELAALKKELATSKDLKP